MAPCGGILPSYEGTHGYDDRGRYFRLEVLTAKILL